MRDIGKYTEKPEKMKKNETNASDAHEREVAKTKTKS